MAALKICIVSPAAYGALTGGRRGHAGGVEQQTAMFARWLASRGHDVSLVTWDEGQTDGEVVDGVRVVTTCRRDAGVKGLRFFHPRWTSLHRALTRVDADVYYQNMGDYVTGQVAAWCRLHRRRFVYSVASDPDCDVRLPKLPARRERTLYRFGLTRADRVIVQTQRQHEMLREGFGIESIVLPMPCALPSGVAHDRTAPPATPRVAWVGRIAPVKRFDVLLEIAKRMPQVMFEVAGKPDTDGDYGRALLERARRVANVKTLGLVPRDQMARVYTSASALLCTSDYEGFPNTFLEAWSLGTPVVSTIDPDGVIARHGLGYRAGTVDEMCRAIAALVDSPNEWLDMSRRARAYVATRHAPEAVLGLFERVLMDDANVPAEAMA